MRPLHQATRNTNGGVKDLVSNLIGAGFESYLESDVAKGRGFLTNLDGYLREMGFVDNITVASNFSTMPRGYGEGGLLKTNFTYVPEYAPDRYNRTTHSDLLTLGILNSTWKENLRTEEAALKRKYTQVNR